LLRPAHTLGRIVPRQPQLHANADVKLVGLLRRTCRERLSLRLASQSLGVQLVFVLHVPSLPGGGDSTKDSQGCVDSADRVSAQLARAQRRGHLLCCHTCAS
jgi:hypothetical protein